MLQITHNLKDLTPSEKREIRKAQTYKYWYGDGEIWLDGGQVSWNCQYTTEAQDYLNKLGVKEIL